MKLVKLSIEYKKQLIDMLQEWVEYNNSNPRANTSPYAIFKNDYNDFDYFLNNLEIKDESNGLVPDSTFFLYDEKRDIFVGASNIRHYLNEGLLKYGGHIGDGIRPSERRKGYGTILIKLSLIECKKLGIDRVLITCNEENIGSKKAILNNGGVLENQIIDEDGSLLNRYWIDLKG